MANNQHFKLSLPLAYLILSLAMGCKDRDQDDTKSTPPNVQNQRGNKKVPTLPINNEVVIFIDKTLSLQNVPSKEIQNGIGDLFERTKSIAFEGANISIYFIHKSLGSSPPFFEKSFALPDTRGITKLPAKKAMDSFKKSIDSLLRSEIDKAVSMPIKKDVGRDTDLFISIKKANDRFRIENLTGKKMILYYSDMIESVKDSRCGRNYERIYFKTVPEAIRAGKSDAIPIKECFGIDKLPEGTKVYLFIPNGSLDLNKHRHIPDYWRALFGEFGVQAVNSNL